MQPRKTHRKQYILHFITYAAFVWIGYLLRWSTERRYCQDFVKQKDALAQEISVAENQSLRLLRSDLSFGTPPCSCSALFRRLKSRRDLSLLMNEMRIDGEGVEIGVRDGDFSDYTLSKWKGKRLHLIDPWLEQNSTIYNDVSNVPQKEQEVRFRSVVQRMETKYPGRYQIHRNLSTDAVKNFENSSLDYVYIDARSEAQRLTMHIAARYVISSLVYPCRHDFHGVMEDLEAWWPKLRAGGLLAGHDFVPDGVVRAVRPTAARLRANIPAFKGPSPVTHFRALAARRLFMRCFVCA